MQKPHMGRVSVAMASDARPHLPTAGEANSSSVSPSRATTQMRPLRRTADGTGPHLPTAGRSAVSRLPMGPTIGFASLRASHPGEPPSRPRGTYAEVPLPLLLYAIAVAYVWMASRHESIGKLHAAPRL